MTPHRRPLLLLPLLGSLATGLGGCVMKRTVTQDGAVVSQGYVVERPLETLHNLETTGPDEVDDD